MSRIETIVFDLGGVLIDWNPRYVFKKVFDTEDEVDYFLSEVCTGEWNAQQDAGRSFEEGIALKQKQFPQYRDVIPLYFDQWTEMIGGEKAGTVALLYKIYEKRAHRLYALTNWSAQTFPYAWENFEFLKLFEGILVSGKEKLIKPDPAIYRLLFRRYDIDPSTAIFIDDSEKNVKAALDIGMQAIHFKDPVGLEKSLKDFDIVS